jgi:hypothetical protein
MQKIWADDELRSHLLERIDERPHRYLFRGQTRRHTTCTSLLARIEGEHLGQSYTILRHLVGRYRGQLDRAEFRGWLKATPEEAIALLQHYGWPSPYLDLTDDLDIAFFFGYDGYEEQRRREREKQAAVSAAVIYCVDREALPNSSVLVSHDEVVDSSLNIRWSRQRGYALRPMAWQGIDECRKLDLERPSNAEIFEFLPDETRLRAVDTTKKQLYAIDREITDQLKFLVRGLGELCGFSSLHPELDKFPK